MINKNKEEIEKILKASKENINNFGKMNEYKQNQIEQVKEQIKYFKQIENTIKDLPKEFEDAGKFCLELSKGSIVLGMEFIKFLQLSLEESKHVLSFSEEIIKQQRYLHNDNR